MSFSGAHWMYKYAIVIPFLHSLKGRPPRAAVPLHRSCIKVYGKDQIDIIFLLILDKAWGFGIHHVDIDLLIFNDSEGVDQELGVKPIIISLPVLWIIRSAFMEPKLEFNFSSIVLSLT